MTTELEKLLADEDKTSAQALEDKSKTKSPEEDKAELALKEEERLANIRKAIAEANAELKTIRTATKKEKSGIEAEEELPKIDFNDSGSKAWDKHIKDTVNPLQAELEKEKEEVRTYALKTFLADKPNLAKDSEGLKRVIGLYNKIKTASERTQEGVLTDLKKAYAAEFADEILEGVRNNRLDEARGDAIFSDIAVSRGSTSIPTEREKAPHLTGDDAAILAKWGMSPDAWVKLKQETDKKK